MRITRMAITTTSKNECDDDDNLKDRNSFFADFIEITKGKPANSKIIITISFQTDIEFMYGSFLEVDVQV